MGLFRDRDSRLKKVTPINAAKSTLPTKSVLLSAICLFCFLKASHATSSSIRDRRKRWLQKKLTNQNRALKYIFFNINHHNIVKFVYQFTSFLS